MELGERAFGETELRIEDVDELRVDVVGLPNERLDRGLHPRDYSRRVGAMDDLRKC